MRQVLVLPAIARSLRQRFAAATLLPPAFGVGGPSLPLWIRRVFQKPSEVGKLFQLRGQHRRFHAEMLTVSDRSEQLRGPAAFGYRGVRYFALPDELRSESRRAAALARRTAQDQRIAAVFDDGMRVALAVGAGDLSDRLKAQHAS